MLEDFRLKVFMTVVNERSFTKAASVLGITQPAVSQNISDLEKMTGRKLFDRLRGSVALTSEGDVFRRYVEAILDTCSSVDDMFAKVDSAVVRISASEEVYAYLVGPALEAFAKVHPEVRFERSLFGESDLAVALVPSSAVPHSTTVNTPTPVVQGEVVSRIRMSVFVPQSLDSLSSSNEKTAYYDVVYRPSAAFACTRLCRLLRQFLVK